MVLVLIRYSLGHVGTKRLQTWGFLLIAATCAALAMAWGPLTKKGAPESSTYTLFGMYVFPPRVPRRSNTGLLGF